MHFKNWSEESLAKNTKKKTRITGCRCLPVSENGEKSSGLEVVGLKHATSLAQSSGGDVKRQLLP